MTRLRIMAILAAVLSIAAGAALSADAITEARIDDIFIRELFDNERMGFRSKEGIRRLYEECAAIDSDYWRVHYLRMLYDDMVAEDRAGILKALDTAVEAWAAFSRDEKAMALYRERLILKPRDQESERAWRLFHDRIRKQIEATQILGMRANLLEAIDEREEAKQALQEQIDAGNVFGRYEGLERMYWLRIKYLTLSEAADLIEEVQATRREVEDDIAMSGDLDAPYMTQFKHLYSIGLGNELAILYGYTYDIQRSREAYVELMEEDRRFCEERGWYYEDDPTLLSNLQLLRLSDFDFVGLDEYDQTDGSSYAYLQARYEALLSRGKPAVARKEIRDAKIDARYLTEGVKRLFRGQSSLLSGDTKAALAHLEYAAGYHEVFRDISYTLGNYQARVYSELVAACRADQGLRRLEGGSALARLPIRAKEFYYRFLLMNNLRANPDYLTLFSPFMLVRDMSLSPYAAAAAIRSLDAGIVARRLDGVESMDLRPRAGKYYRLLEAEMALASGDRAKAAALLEGPPEGWDDPDVGLDERLYLAMAYDARARLAQVQHREDERQAAVLAAYRVFPSYAAGLGQRFTFSEMSISDGVGGKEGRLMTKRVRKAAASWNISWKKGRDDLPAPRVELSANGLGESRRYIIRVKVDDPGAYNEPYAVERDEEVLVVYAQDLKKGDYPSWILRAIFGIKLEEKEALEADPASLVGI